MFIGIGTSMVYNYFTVVLAVLTRVPPESISIFLFANGIAAIVGTSLFGYFINKKNNFPIAIYPIVFAIIIILFGIGVEVPGYVFIIMILYGLLDGSLHTISQYWLSSSIKEAPEFANGAYLFVNNMNRAFGIFIGGIFVDFGLGIVLLISSVSCFLLACPTALYRIKKYPKLR